MRLIQEKLRENSDDKLESSGSARKTNDRLAEDVSYSELRFPTQAFRFNVGMDGHLDGGNDSRSLRELKFPETTIKLPLSPLENESYKITKTNNTASDSIEEIELKKFQIKVKIEGKKEVNQAEEVVKLVSDIQDIISNVNNMKFGENGVEQSSKILLPEQITLSSDTAYVMFNHEGINFLGSSRFLVSESSDAQILPLVEKTVASCQAEIINLFGKIDVKYHSRAEITKSSEELSRKLESLSKKVDGDELFSLLFTTMDPSDFPEEHRKEFMDLQKEALEIEHADGVMSHIENIESINNHSISYLENSTEYSGVTADGKQIILVYNRHDQSIKIYDQEKSLLLEEKPFMDRIVIDSLNGDGTTEVTLLPVLNAAGESVKKLVNSNMQTVWSEEYSAEGRLLKRWNNELGFAETFYSNGTSVIDVYGSKSVFQNYKEIKEHPRAEEIFMKAAEMNGINNLDDYFMIIHVVPGNRLILEKALEKVSQFDLEKMINEVETLLTSFSAVPDSIKNQLESYVELGEFNDLLKFRLRMLKDGSELSRANPFVTPSINPSPYLWNDVKSRGFFEIEDSWIDWESDKVISLLNKDHEELSKKDLKLLVTRLLFDAREPLNEQTVNDAISRIYDLRKEYGSLDILSGRNIIVAANNEVVNLSFDGVDKKLNSFGKIKMIETLEMFSGEEHQVKVFRSEQRMDNQEELQEVKKKILDEISNMPAPFTFIFDGHGSPGGMFLSDGQVGDNSSFVISKGTAFISPEELASAILKRNEDKNNIDSDKNVIIVNSCFGANFIRKVSELIEPNSNTILIGASEYNQFSYYNPGSEYGSDFLYSTLFGFNQSDEKSSVSSERTQDTTLEGVIERQYDNSTNKNETFKTYGTNPSIIVPDKDGRMKQIGGISPSLSRHYV